MAPANVDKAPNPKRTYTKPTHWQASELRLPAALVMGQMSGLVTSGTTV